MCDSPIEMDGMRGRSRTVSVQEAVGLVLAHDITEIVPGQTKGRAFRKGHLVRREDICHLRRLGKERLYILEIADDEMHENDAAQALANALAGDGVEISGEPREGRLNLVASRGGILRIDREALLAFNRLGEVMAATLHEHTRVSRGQVVAGTRAVPLVIRRDIVEEAVRLARGRTGHGTVSVAPIRQARAGIVVTGNEVYYGRIPDAFAPVMRAKIEELGGEVVGVRFAPDDAAEIEARLRELLELGADLLVTTGGMSVDPDDVTRFAVGRLGAGDSVYGSAVLPGSMCLVAYLGGSGKSIPVIGVPACAIFHKRTIVDLILPRILSGERIGREELAALGHGGLCLNCAACTYPVCPFGKG